MKKHREASGVERVMQRLTALRLEMDKEGLDAWLVPSGDPHLSEYVADHWKTREWLSGFAGSAGTLVVTMAEGLLWTDGRYFVQAEKELEGTGIQLMKMATPGYPTLLEWLEKHLDEGCALGLDGTLYAAGTVKEYAKKLDAKKIRLSGGLDLPGRIWADRPAIPATPVFIHEAVFAGDSPAEKLEQIRGMMRADRADQSLFSALDGIAWLFDIRGADVQNNPVTIAYGRVGKNDAELFIDSGKLDAVVRKHLSDNGVAISPYESVQTALAAFPAGSRVAYDAKLTNASLVRAIPAGCVPVEIDDYLVKAKAVKSAVEIENLKRCQARDGAAMVRFLMWLEEAVPRQPAFEKEGAVDAGPEPIREGDDALCTGPAPVTELDVVSKLTALRAALPLAMGDSFDAIAAYRANAAMMHYKASPDSHSILEPHGLLLVDCGGQYLDGTTDITRTVALGPISDVERTACTLTLQSHIGLAQACFLEGSTGSNLDVLARMPMWKNGMDYKCGTGHGVGYFLSVHEGPQGFRQMHSPIKLMPGMIITNEPGVYRAGLLGARTENTMLVVPAFQTEDGTFYKFETISCCPIDVKTLDLGRLSFDEKEWLDEYHRFVFGKVSPHLDKTEQAWLKEATKAVSRDDCTAVIPGSVFCRESHS